MIGRCMLAAMLLGTATLLGGCKSNVTGNNDYEYSEDFSLSRSTAGITAISIDNINGNVTLTGKDSLAEIQITGQKAVEAGTYEIARNHIGDIETDTLTAQNEFDITTTQPDGSNGLTYRADYEITVPKNWKATVINVNGNASVVEIDGGVSVHLTNGLFDAEGINGNVAANLTNGNISAKVILPDSGSCELRTLNGNVLLSIPDSTSATLSASVVNGSVSISNLHVVTSSSTSTHFTGTIGSGSGSIVLSTLNGIIQLTRM